MTFFELTAVLGNLGDFLGSLAVLATLVYLSTQVRESNRSAQLSAVIANRAERRAWFLSNRDSPYVAPIMAKRARGENLSDEEAWRFGGHLAAEFSVLYSEWVSREIGLLGEYAVSDAVVLRFITASDAHRDWFRRIGRDLYPARFCEHVERAFAEATPTTGS
jgi:hypothetical protein